MRHYQTIFFMDKKAKFVAEVTVGKDLSSPWPVHLRIASEQVKDSDISMHIGSIEQLRELIQSMSQALIKALEVKDESA